MVNRLRQRALPVLILVLSGALPVHGQTIPSPYRFLENRHEVGIFSGSLGQERGQFAIGPSGGPVLGLRYAFDVAGPFGLEAVTSAVQGTRNVIDPRSSEGPIAVGESDVLLLSVEGRARFALNGRRTWHGLGPYLYAGAGVVFDAEGAGTLDRALQEQDRFSVGTSFLGSFGGGVRWIPGERLSIRLDTEARFQRLSTPEGFTDVSLGIASVPRNRWVVGTGWMLGVGWRF